jgi:hypothetical protein
MVMLKINGVPVKAPSVFQADISDIDGEGTTRNARGDLLRDRLSVKRKLNCEWGPLTMAEISTLLQAVQAVFFSVTYPDPMTGALAETKTFYVGDRTSPVLFIRDGEPLWKGLKMNFIEK